MAYEVLKADVDRECRLRGIEKRAIAREIGISPNTLSKFFCGNRETQAVATRLENWLESKDRS